MCRHCAAGGKPPYGAHYSLAELRALRSEWGPLWPYHEASAHPEFPDIIGCDIVPDGHTVLATNGFGLARRSDYKDVFKRIQGMGYGMVSFTLHGLHDRHDRFVARKGAFQDILTAGRKAKECGVGVHWNVYLDRQNLEEVPVLVEWAQREFAGFPWISVPRHRVSRRLWRYEKLRPSADDLRRRLPRNLVPESAYLPLEQRPIEEFSEAAWLRVWQTHPDSDAFKDPTPWPLQPPFESVVICMTREREVYLDSESALPIPLGPLSDGKETILQRLRQVPAPEGSCLRPEHAKLPPEDRDLVHPNGFSVKCKAASYRLYSETSDSPLLPPGAAETS